MLEYTGGRIHGAILRPLAETDSLAELTELLHRAYAALARSGLRFLGSWQDEEVTRRRVASCECWVAELNGRIIATATLRPPGRSAGTPWYQRRDVAVMGQFAVEPDLQGSGLGTALLQQLEVRAHALGVRHLAVDTAEGATRLIQYYERLGYVFVEYVQWEVTNYRSVVLSKPIGDTPHQEVADADSGGKGKHLSRAP